jgi:hypothetical protein
VLVSATNRGGRQYRRGRNSLAGAMTCRLASPCPRSRDIGAIRSLTAFVAWGSRSLHGVRVRCVSAPSVLDAHCTSLHSVWDVAVVYDPNGIAAATMIGSCYP